MLGRSVVRTVGAMNAMKGAAPIRRNLAMKPGTPIAGLNFLPKESAPIALERSEYPEWMASLATPMPSLAELRRTPNEDASHEYIMRYLKLTRRIRIKQHNIDANA
jgi:hypothetical protein